MDNRNLTLHTTVDGSGVFRDTDAQTYCTIRPFKDVDPDIERDPLSTNRRLFDSGGIDLFGSMVVAGPTTDIIYMLVPDSTTCTADEICPAYIQHVIGLRLGPAENLGSILPREDLHLSLCENSLRPTLIADRRIYWAEVTPLLQRWQSINNTSCPHCHRMIWVNRSRHLRASHTDNQCFWRCPVSTCHMWFSSELNEKDHIERIHSFREGQGCSFYECLRRYGMEWFGKRSYFDQREQSNQAMLLDIELAHQSGQELNNHYIITISPATSHIRRFFNASIRHLTTTYQQIAADQAFHDIRPSICDQMRREIASIKEESEQPQDQASGGDPPISDDDIAMATSPVVETPRRSSTPNNRSLAVMEASWLDAPHCHVPLARGVVTNTSISSYDLQTFIEQLPLDQLLCYSPSTMHSWPAADREEILAVANRDMVIVRRNVADISRYLDTHAAHLAACAGALDDSIPLMAAETFPRLPGGIRSALQDLQRD